MCFTYVCAKSLNVVTLYKRLYLLTYFLFSNFCDTMLLSVVDFLDVTIHSRNYYLFRIQQAASWCVCYFHIAFGCAGVNHRNVKCSWQGVSKRRL